jgi:hypothetical protein
MVGGGASMRDASRIADGVMAHLSGVVAPR